MTRTIPAAAVALALLLPRLGIAGVDGYWKTVDDETGNTRSLVKIEIVDGVAKGTIVQLYRQPDEEADPLCDECDPPLDTQKIVGMEIMKGLKSDGSTWSGGTIMDPGNGSTYSCFIEEQDGGKKLKVRGYIGFSLLGRTQYWYKAEPPDTNIRTFLLNASGKALPYVFADGHMATKEEIEAHNGGPLPPPKD